MGGTMSFNQIANVLSNKGDYVLSGHLPDTFVYDNKVAKLEQRLFLFLHLCFLHQL